MTRGDFILGVLSSLIATILYDLTRKFYPRLKAFYPKVKAKAVEFNKRSIAIIAAQRLTLSSFIDVTTYNLSTVRPSSYIRLAIIIFVLIITPIHTGIAPSNDEIDPAIIKETSVTAYFKEGKLYIAEKPIDTRLLNSEIDTKMEKLYEAKPYPNAAINRELLDCGMQRISEKEELDEIGRLGSLKR